MRPSHTMKLCLVLCALALAGTFAGCKRTPVPNFTADQVEGAAPLTVQFTDQSTIGKANKLVKWEWDFGDGGTSTDQNPAHTYTAAGTYTVRLVVTHDNGRAAEMVKPDYITVAGIAADKTTLMGYVTLPGGAALPLATVNVGTLTATTDSTGHYALTDLDPAAGMVVRFSKEGHTGNAVVVAGIAGGITTANATLKPLADPVPLDAAAGGTVADGLSNTVTFGETAFVTKSGRKSVAGTVDVSITPLDVTDGDDLAAFPGNFLAVGSAKDGDTVQLETFALADYTVTQDGEELDLAPGSSATIELSLPANTPLAGGQSVPLWSFNEATGLWVQEGEGQVVASARKAGGLVYQATITHLSWWNCDAPLSDKNCVTGTVVDEAGAPVAGAPVEAAGVTYNGVTSGVTGPDGSFCLNVKRGSTVTVRIYLPGGRVVVREATVTVPDAEASCATGGCTNAGSLQLTFDSCVSGRVLGEDGAPLANVEVRASSGNTAVTDANGNYCMPAPANISVSVYVLGRPPVVVTTPPAASCAAGNCAVADVVVDYPDDGDLVGVISADVVNRAGGTPIKATIPMLSGSGSFFAWNGGMDQTGPVTSDDCQ
ncbi:MAG TPA: PKD domain-containing protein, partial [Candidatus Hydrogenedentes bacterium]|nr:PKD domain-containing protein [Candidatus Hydrogenedentota bacterium]